MSQEETGIAFSDWSHGYCDFKVLPSRSEQVNKKQSPAQSQMQWQTAAQVRASIQQVVLAVEEKQSFGNRLPHNPYHPASE